MESRNMQKFQDLIGTGLQKYILKETGQPDKNVELTFNPTLITQAGSKDRADYFNNIQKSLLYKVAGTRATEGTSDVYSIAITGSDVFDIFETQLLFIPNETNSKTAANVKLKFNGNYYQIKIKNDGEIRDLIASDIRPSEEYIGWLDITNGFFIIKGTSLKYVFKTIAELEAANWLKLNDVVEILGYYTPGDGSNHYRILQNTGLSGNVAIGSLFANIRKSDVVDISWFGALTDGTTDIGSAFIAAKALALSFLVPIKFSRSGTYYYAGSRPDLSGVDLIFEKNTILKVDENPNTKEMQLLTPVTILNPLHGNTLIQPQNTLLPTELYKLSSALTDLPDNSVSTIVDMTTWENRVYLKGTGSIASAGTGTLAPTQLTWASDFLSSAQLLMLASASDENSLYEVSAYNNAAAGAGVGILVKKASEIEYINFVVGSGVALWYKLDFLGNVTSSGSKAMPNGGAYGWLSGQEINMGYVRKGTSVWVVVNGLPFYKIDNIVYVAFYIDFSGDATKVTIKDLIKTTNYKLSQKKKMTISVIGDSICYGAWDSLAIEDLLPLAVGKLKDVETPIINNLAVSGQASGYFVTNPQTVTGSKITLIMLGTNDQQGSVAVATYISNMTTIINAVIAQGSIPIVGIFPIFTTSSISGVTGVTTTGYANHAKYTHALKKLCITNGYAFADIRRAIGANITLYGDNIHPTVDGQINIVAEWASAIKKVLETNLVN